LRRIAIFALGVACTVADIDYTGKACTDVCPNGLVCIGNTCQSGSSNDAAIDDGSSDAPTPSSCGDAGDAMRFCDDFERTTVQGPWDSVLTINDGVLEIIADGDAGNHVLHAAIVDGSASTSALAYVSKTLGDSISTVTCQFRIYVTGAAWSSAALVGISVMEGDGTRGDIGVDLTYAVDGGTGSSVKGIEYHTQLEGGSFGNTELLLLPEGQWTPVSITADYNARTVKIVVDGKTAYDGVLTSPSPNWTPGEAGVRAGLVALDSTGFRNNSTFDLRIDDVVVDYAH
jgi:hypothetical protein